MTQSPGPRLQDDVLTASVAQAIAGQFTLEREIGRGGMGVVYLARDVKLERLVALKVLPLEVGADVSLRERFIREARTAARLAHPNVVPVFRADELHGIAFFAMAYVDGESLGERLAQRGLLPPNDAVRILREVAWALAYAHARGIVHRDVKPENILLERGTGRALVTDFGIARMDAMLAPGAERLTQDGHIVGTLHYMSPEQVSGGDADGRSDLYALGVVAYQMLSGQLPFGDLHGSAVLVAHATRIPRPLHEIAPSVPEALAAVVDRCLRKDPADRYQTGEALADAFDDAMADAPTQTRDTGAGLPPGFPTRLSETQATTIWKRAAHLQAEALQRMEARRDLLANVEETREGLDALSAGSGYRVTDIAEAAEEAGISRQYVAMALAEVPRGAMTEPGEVQTGVSERQATRFLGTEQRSLGVSHIVNASPARTLRALGAALQRSPYELEIRDSIGAHPLDGGVIVFDLPGPIIGLSGGAAGAYNYYWMGTHQQLEVRQLQVTLRGISGAANRTEVTMTCDLRPGVRRNVLVSQGIAIVAGALGGAGSGAIASVIAAKAAIALGVLMAAPVAAGAALLGGGSVAWYRWLYPSAMKKAQNEMLRSLQAVSASVQSENVFGTPAGEIETRGGGVLRSR